MNHSESEYVNAGYKLERGRLSFESVRQMIESERVEDRAEARRLIELGRAESRKGK